MKSDFSILLVDDLADILMVLQEALAKQGFRVFSANSAIKGAEIIKTNKIDLIITDIDMPEINGIDFLFWIRENSPKSKVILMTAFDKYSSKNFLEKGAVGYFEKPINIKKLISYINSNFIHKTFHGNIKNINILDLLKIFVISGKNKFIEIKDENSDNKGYIYIKNSNVVHSEFNEIVGEEAFFKIIKIKNGAFKELKWEEPNQITVLSPFSYLFKEAFRILQEEHNINRSNIPYNRILLVDDDKITTMIIEKYLKEKGFYVKSVQSAIEGSELLTKEAFGFVITDINMPDVNGLEFLLWISQYSPRSKVIMITASGSDEIKNFAQDKGALGYFDKPVSLKELEFFIKNNSEENFFSGTLNDIDLLQFVEIVLLSGNNKLIRVNDPLKPKEAVIYIKEGRVIHAFIDNKKGEEAFLEILSLKSGLFIDNEWEEPSEISIDSPMIELLKKASEVMGNNSKIKEDTESKALVTSRSRLVQKALNRKQDLSKFIRLKEGKQKLTIYTSGVALGIVLGMSNKSDVINQLKVFSSDNLESQKDNQMIIVEDLSLNILFDELGFAEEMNFGKLYKGTTEEGIKIGDTLEKVLSTYGKPKVCTIRGAVWDNVAFFSDDNKTVSSIRIRNLNYFERKPVLSNSEVKIQ